MNSDCSPLSCIFWKVAASLWLTGAARPWRFSTLKKPSYSDLRIRYWIRPSSSTRSSPSLSLHVAMLARRLSRMYLRVRSGDSSHSV